MQQIIELRMIYYLSLKCFESFNFSYSHSQIIIFYLKYLLVFIIYLFLFINNVAAISTNSLSIPFFRQSDFKTTCSHNKTANFDGSIKLAQGHLLSRQSQIINISECVKNQKHITSNQFYLKPIKVAFIAQIEQDHISHLD